MRSLDMKVIEVMLSDIEAMKTAKEFIQKYQATLREPSADQSAYQGML
jgi:hypothetical protein